MTADINELNDAVLEVITDFSDEYEATESVDYASRCSMLKEGATVPAKGGIKLTENVEHIGNYGYAAEERIRDLCDAQRRSVLDSMSDAPSEEALRMMQSISLRENGVSKSELEALASKYGSCYQVRRFVADQMLKRELGIPKEDECDKALRLIDHAEEVGVSSVSPREVGKKTYGKAARLAIIRQQLRGEGLFGAF